MSNPSKLDYFEVFPWNRNFETGLNEIDRQHKTLVELLNKLANTLIHEEPIEINLAFEELAKYADYHFETEENTWAEYFGDDSWFINHQERHSSFLPKVLELKEKHAHLPLHEVVEQIIKFLIRWLAFHIIDDDKRLAVAVESIRFGSSIDEAKAIADRKMNGSNRVLIDTVMVMYEGLSSRTLELMRERHARKIVEQELLKANQQLERLSVTDQLTGLFNRREFEPIFNNELQRAKREGNHLNFILLDIDYFKKINDDYGHTYGDETLVKVGHKLQELCRRPSDFVFRLGGEEFAIITTTNPEQSVQLFAEKVRKGIASLKIPNKNSSVIPFLTVSAGVINISPDTFERDPSTLFKQADQHLYTAKQTGRNKVITNGVVSICEYS